jgi:hypothetical protein
LTWQKVKVRAESKEEGNMLLELTSSKIYENLIKMAEKLPRYQMLLVLEKAASPPSTAVSQNGALNSLSGSRLTSLMR